MCRILLWDVACWSRSRWLGTLQQICWYSGTGRYRIFLEHLHSHWKPLVYRHFLEQREQILEEGSSQLFNTIPLQFDLCSNGTIFFIDHHRNDLKSYKVKRTKVNGQINLWFKKKNVKMYCPTRKQLFLGKKKENMNINIGTTKLNATLNPNNSTFMCLKTRFTHHLLHFCCTIINTILFTHVLILVKGETNHVSVEKPTGIRCI